MLQRHLPYGQEYTLAEAMLPDTEAALRLFAPHWRKVRPGWRYPLHRHDLFELNAVEEGGQRMTVEGRTFRLSEGDMLLIRPGEEHAAEAEGERGMAYFCLHFDVDDPVLRRMLRTGEQPFHSSGSAVAARLRAPVDKLLRLTRFEEDATISARMLVLAASFELCAALAEVFASEQERAEGSTDRQLALAARIAGLIEKAVPRNGDGADPDEESELSAIAGRLGYSVSYCNRVFNRVYGMSPRQYLSNLKLREAKWLLAGGELTVERIADLLGYRDAARFSRQFKRWTGRSPMQFRKSAREAEAGQFDLEPSSSHRMDVTPRG